jgi:hypothetical protein
LRGAMAGAQMRAFEEAGRREAPLMPQPQRAVPRGRHA